MSVWKEINHIAPLLAINQ